MIKELELELQRGGHAGHAGRRSCIKYTYKSYIITLQYRNLDTVPHFAHWRRVREL